MFTQTRKMMHVITKLPRTTHNLKTMKQYFRNYTISKDDFSLLENPTKRNELRVNMYRRDGTENLTKIQHLLETLRNEQNTMEMDRIVKQLQMEIKRIPNDTHPDVENLIEHPRTIAHHGFKPNFDFQPQSFMALAKKMNICRTEHLGNFSGVKSYYLMKELAELEQALIQFTINTLLKQHFELVTVPDFLPADTIEGCGMSVTSDRTQVYHIEPNSLCLSGTSEMALAGYFSDKILKSMELPRRMMAVSRCFRAETSGLQDEKGIYRVHNFTKVEMFSVCRPNESETILNQFREIEIALYDRLGLHFRVLDMPPCELGTPAYRKFDIEAWIPSRSVYGEISSCSNCTDYQAKRLNIQFEAEAGKLNFAHTVNGTACAIPRMLIAIVENYQNADGTVTIPECLREFMEMNKQIKRSKVLPELKLVKQISANFTK